MLLKLLRWAWCFFIVGHEEKYITLRGHQCIKCKTWTSDSWELDQMEAKLKDLYESVKELMDSIDHKHTGTVSQCSSILIKISSLQLMVCKPKSQKLLDKDK